MIELIKDLIPSKEIQLSLIEDRLTNYHNLWVEFVDCSKPTITIYDDVLPFMKLKDLNLKTLSTTIKVDNADIIEKTYFKNRLSYLLYSLCQYISNVCKDSNKVYISNIVDSFLTIFKDNDQTYILARIDIYI